LSSIWRRRKRMILRRNEILRKCIEEILYYKKFDLLQLVIGGTGIPTGIFRDPGTEIPGFWVYRYKYRAGINTGKYRYRTGTDIFEPFFRYYFWFIFRSKTNTFFYRFRIF
jgi:hypothetical protein